MRLTGGNSTQQTDGNGVELDRSARSALERSSKRAFSDQEWIRVRGKLIEFYAVLSDWEKHAAKGYQESS